MCLQLELCVAACLKCPIYFSTISLTVDTIAITAMSVIVFVSDVSLGIICSTRFRYGFCHLFHAKWLLVRSAADTAKRQLSFL